MTRTTIPLAQAKARLSDLVVRAGGGGEEFVITRHGRPAAVLTSPLRRQPGADLADVRGWLSDDDPFFRRIEETRQASRRRGPRAWRRD